MLRRTPSPYFKDVDREVTGCATRFAKTTCNWCSPWIAVLAAECLRFEALSSEGLTTLLPCVSGAGSVKPMCKTDVQHWRGRCENGWSQGDPNYRYPHQ